MTAAPAARALPARASRTRPGPAPAPRDDPGPPPAPAPRPEPGRCASTELDAHPTSAAAARRITRDALTRWNLHQLTDDAEVIASELAANAIAAAPPGSPAPAIILTLHYQPPDLTIRMWDTGPGQPSPATPGHDAEDGRGLLLIGRLSEKWGWWPCPHSGGKVVWSRLTTKASPPGHGSPP